MYEEAAIARKDSLGTPSTSQNILIGEQQGSVSQLSPRVGSVVRRQNSFNHSILSNFPLCICIVIFNGPTSTTGYVNN
jgi:hypothetical protein